MSNQDKVILKTTCPRDCYDSCGINAVRRQKNNYAKVSKRDPYNQ